MSIEDTLFDFDKDDYILVNNKGEVLAVSGNTDFDSYPEEYIILKVVEKTAIEKELEVDFGWPNGI
jgi:hypothetical protein